MSQDDACKYKEVKRAILRRYDIHEETYRQRFRFAKPKEGETPVELTTRVQDLADKWLKVCGPREVVVDAVVKEQLLNTLPQDVRVWVKERKPATSKEAGRLAEDYLQAQKTTSKSKQGLRSDKHPTGPRLCYTCG